MSEQENSPVNPQPNPEGAQAQTPPPAQQYSAEWQQPQQSQPQQQPQAAVMQQPQQNQAGMAQQQQMGLPQQQTAWQQPPAGIPYQQPAANPYQQQEVPAGVPAPAASSPKQTNTKAILALVFGIVAIVTSSTIVLGVLLGIAAIVLGMLANAQARDGKATAGFVCGIVGVVLSAIMIIGVGATISSGGSMPTLFNFGGASSSSAPKTPLYQKVKGEVIADDSVCTIKITKMEIDETNDNLYVHFDITDNVPKGKGLTLKTSSDEPWEVNGEKAQCTCFTKVDPGKKKSDYFVIKSSYLTTNNINEIESVTGTLYVDLGTSVDMDYVVALF